MQTDDPRKGRPSCSGLRRLELCPGSFRMEQGKPDRPTDDSDRGTRIHAFLAGETSGMDLDDDDRMVADLCHRQTAEVVEQWGERHGLKTWTIETHRRLWFGNRCSGEADMLVTSGAHALIVDWKTGRVGAEDATVNAQLRGLVACLWWEAKRIDSVTVALVQPLVGQPQVALYEGEHITRAAQWLTDTLNAAARAENLVPSEEACKYCRAKPDCPALAMASRIEPVHHDMVTPGRWATLTPTEKREAWDAARLAERWAAAVKSAVKEDLMQGHSVHGCELTKGRTMAVIPDAEAAWQRLAGELSPAAFASACKVSLPSLADAYAAATGAGKKDARQAVEHMLGDEIEWKQSEPSVKSE